ncbi:Uncharacterized conserved protein, DUF1697 family [Psychrobacillus sp. OK028]|uniref:DUF1697 domain-containing protein n=1 Tax=Psychrobacillus sp. OK028 TaxID=1884359 RepID=UPI00088AC425|nr:DUF1697 domain-containing protein [Psychrobacillus sp. OK028]SDN63557.1 Uncharacterized conserved protein, DUF1697 family [Psychrobacillus sp. OK028]
MPSVILLRGINLGAKNKVDMKSLKSLFIEMGYKNVQTYIQTGNVLVEQPDIDVPFIEGALRESYGFEIPVAVRSKEELAEIVQLPVFSKEQVYVMFLVQEISEEQQEMLASLIDDEFVVWKKQNVIINLSKNYHQTKFTNAFFERKLGIPSTARNKNTVNKILGKLS